jgi:hypothetical protein
MSRNENGVKETLEQRIIREWKANASIRAEFGNLNRYRAYVVARESGRVKTTIIRPTGFRSNG